MFYEVMICVFKNVCIETIIVIADVYCIINCLCITFNKHYICLQINVEWGLKLIFRLYSQ